MSKPTVTEKILWEGKIPAGLDQPSSAYKKYNHRLRIIFRLGEKGEYKSASLLGEVYSNKNTIGEYIWSCCSPAIEHYMLEQYIKESFGLPKPSIKSL